MQHGIYDSIANTYIQQYTRTKCMHGSQLRSDELCGKTCIKQMTLHPQNFIDYRYNYSVIMHITNCYYKTQLPKVNTELYLLCQAVWIVIC